MGYILSATTWITVANLAYLASYAVRDILHLRILTVAATLLLIPYYYLQPVPLWAPIGWNLVFTAINGYWIVRLIIERRPVHLTADEQRLRELSFPSLTAREALNLYAMGSWDDLEPGASLVQHDNAQTRFSVILFGKCDVQWRGRTIAELGQGQFTGTLERDYLADLDIAVRARTRVMCWPRVVLIAFMKDRPDVALALERSVGLELTRLLETTLSEMH
jgi:hypothetical protein